jgi:hypothetical protein
MRNLSANKRGNNITLYRGSKSYMSKYTRNFWVSGLYPSSGV